MQKLLGIENNSGVIRWKWSSYEKFNYLVVTGSIENLGGKRDVSTEKVDKREDAAVVNHLKETGAPRSKSRPAL